MLTLTQEEKETCRLVGCSEEAYLETRDGKAAPAGLNDDDLAMCRAFGVASDLYAKSKAETGGRERFKAPDRGEIVACRLYFDLAHPGKLLGAAQV
jgi:hypothetical protein